MSSVLVGECSHSFHEFSQTFTTRKKHGEYVFYFFGKYHDEKKKNRFFTLIIKMLILFALAIIRSTARASSVFLTRFSTNLLAFYHEYRSLIGYATYYLFKKIDSMLPLRLFSNESQMTSKCGMNKKVAHEAIAKCVTDVFTTF